MNGAETRGHETGDEQDRRRGGVDRNGVGERREEQREQEQAGDDHRREPRAAALLHAGGALDIGGGGGGPEHGAKRRGAGVRKQRLAQRGNRPSSSRKPA